MTVWQIMLVGLAAFCAGAMNAVAGLGTFFSFPVLLAVGVLPVVANASNSVALWPASLSGAWAYRNELARYKCYLIPMGIVSFIGSIGGGLLLLSTKDATFSQLIPWLLLFATLLFMFSGRLSVLLRAPTRLPESPIMALLQLQANRSFPYMADFWRRHRYIDVGQSRYGGARRCA